MTNDYALRQTTWVVGITSEWCYKNILSNVRTPAVNCLVVRKRVLKGMTGGPKLLSRVTFGYLAIITRLA